MKRYWVCNACGAPCRLVFHEPEGAPFRNLRGSACCDALVHTKRIETPIQAHLLVYGVQGRE